MNVVLRTLGVKEEFIYRIEELNLLERQILQYIKNHNNELKDFDGIIKEMHFAYITIYRAVSSLVNKGLLERVGSRKTGYWILK